MKRLRRWAATSVLLGLTGAALITPVALVLLAVFVVGLVLWSWMT